jgi:hypothetical protein
MRPAARGLAVSAVRWFGPVAVGVLGQSRLLSAGQFQGAADDIGVSIDTPVLRRSGSGYEVDVTGVIRPDRLSFSDVDGRHVAAFDVVVFGSDERNHVLGEIHNIVDLKLRTRATKTCGATASTS